MPLDNTALEFSARAEDRADPDLGTLLQQLIAELAQLRQLLKAGVAVTGEQAWEYLSLSAVRNSSDEKYYVPGFNRRGRQIEEAEVLRQLGTVGWRLVAVVPTCQEYEGGAFHHQLYLKRSGPTGPSRD